MALQLRVGLGLGCACLAAHTAFVHYERQLAPRGRALNFTPGSQDDLASERLRTGDLVVFSRDCLLYGACGALACQARKVRGDGGAGYDHVGVVYLHHGVPHVLERTHSGVQLRRLSARVRCSRAREVFVRALQPPLTPQQLAAAAEACAQELAPQPLSARAAQEALAPPPSLAMAASLASPAAAADALGEAAALAAGRPGANGSIALAARFYAAVLGAPSAPSGSAAGDLARLGAVPTGQLTSAAGTAQRFGPPYWFRDLS